MSFSHWLAWIISKRLETVCASRSKHCLTSSRGYKAARELKCWEMEAVRCPPFRAIHSVSMRWQSVDADVIRTSCSRACGTPIQITAQRYSSRNGLQKSLASSRTTFVLSSSFLANLLSSNATLTPVIPAPMMTISASCSIGPSLPSLANGFTR